MNDAKETYGVRIRGKAKDRKLMESLAVCRQNYETTMEGLSSSFSMNTKCDDGSEKVINE
jgi:hypothetical protein